MDKQKRLEEVRKEYLDSTKDKTMEVYDYISFLEDKFLKAESGIGFFRAAITARNITKGEVYKSLATGKRDLVVVGDDGLKACFSRSWFDQVTEDMSLKYDLFDTLYGKYVQMDDRFESVHIWSEDLAHANKGRWTPQVISEEKYKEVKDFFNASLLAKSR